MKWLAAGVRKTRSHHERRLAKDTKCVLQASLHLHVFVLTHLHFSDDAPALPRCWSSPLHPCA